MKKMLTLLVVGLSLGFASAKSFDDKTSIPQLTYRTLEAGQVAWNEEDGAAVMYIGSPTETKNLRVIDPTAIRGYRYKQITSELTFNGSSNMEMLENGTYKYTIRNDSSPLQYDYNPITSKETVTTNREGQISKYYCRYDPSTGEYTHADLPVGYEIDPAVETIYWRMQYHLAQVQVFSKDSIIEELDYVYLEIQGGGLGDFPEIATQRSITYDGRKAVLDIKVTAGRPQDWFTVSTFTAKCKGIGDQEYVNDVTGELSVKIKDSEGTYDLSNLRHELYHKYDGNRGVDWSKYKAVRDIVMGGYNLTFNNTNANVSSALGVSGKTFQIYHGGSSFFKFVPPPELSPSSPYYGMECRFSAINYPTAASGNCWTLDFIINKPVPKKLIEVYYTDDLTKTFWNPIDVEMIDTQNDQMNWHVIVPQEYGTPKAGFFKIKFLVNALDGKLDLKTSVRLLGDDGHMYKLTFPTGGGTVTATLDE